MVLLINSVTLAQSVSVTVTVTGCGFDPHSKKLNIY